MRYAIVLGLLLTGAPAMVSAQGRSGHPNKGAAPAAFREESGSQDRAHEDLHSRLERAHQQWHFAHDRGLRDEKWNREHDALHERLDREHEKWHQAKDSKRKN